MKRFSPITILLVEDSPDDVAIVQEALGASDVSHHLHVVRDGQEALDFLFQQGAFTQPPAPRPDLVLLDLNIPKVTGFEVLQKVRASERFLGLPVIILSNSVANEDVRRGYRLGANTYIQKRSNFVEVIEVLGEYWSVFATLPPEA